ncbi:TetR/AcrR family transcriptional regulator [Gracilibacillus caseinilyticus]|uniref:TetR/AcrR family transcriptional regulator n=1 Tax=Gracilibacillus caseinilyticus TaxID=2932256 RepID=A0ABY4F0S4_9BACI|nr:TetR/AcrR family transcriptional regulator [Gracilibacillus caseinilyticus]UOQ50272.1 TetR/AcrR family transcriptional regulator [Gracilibacillus caseinilyticus]
MSKLEDKKKRIMQESLKLFAEKGFHTTSIQEIASTSEVSKGAFYIHFDSKDDLLVEIFKYYSETIMEKLNRMEHSSDDPFETFTNQIAAFLDLYKDHKEYLLMHFRDNIHLGDKMDDLIRSLHKQSYDWMEERLRNIYGSQLSVHMTDIIIQVDSLLSGYFKWIAIHHLDFDSTHLASYITHHINLMIQDVLQENAPPIFQYQDLTQFNEKDELAIQENIDALYEKIARLSEQDKQEAKEAIQVLEEERTKQKPKRIIIQSMLQHLETHEELQAHVQNIKKYL